jgi:hypothetical protein
MFQKIKNYFYHYTTDASEVFWTNIPEKQSNLLDMVLELSDQVKMLENKIDKIQDMGYNLKDFTLGE